MKFLIACSGSYGDVYPFIAIGRELRDRGHEVVLTTSGYFAKAVTGAGLDFEPVGEADEYEALVRHPDLTHPQKGLRVIGRAICRYLPATYETLDRLAGPDTVLIGSTLAFAAPILHEKRGLPWVPVHLAPSIFRSSIEPPRVTPSGIPAWLPAPVIDAVWSIADRFFIDPFWCPGINRFRESLGLTPVSRIFADWIHSDDLTIGLFPDWFGSPQPDWPASVRCTNFPLYDQAEQPLDADVREFLDAGEPPVVFVCGTAIASESTFFAESVAACGVAGMRGLLLTRFPDQLPDTLPDGVAHFPGIPFSRLLPRCAAIVHHGGIGTLSQSLRAGIPQVVRPYGFDQFDNARRLVRLGVAAEISVRRYRAQTVARHLERLVADRSVHKTCRDIADRMSAANPVAETCDCILERTA